MRARTRTLSCERALLDAMLGARARVQRRPPERVSEVLDGERTLHLEGATPLLLNGVLPPDHPLSDSPEDILAKLRRRRGL